MDSTWLDHVAWAEQQWGEIALGDPRRNRRAVAVGAALAAQPDGSLPQQCGDWAALKAAYRLLDNDAFSHAGLAGGHWNATRAQATQHTEAVLFVQDTSDLDFSTHPATAGLGHIGDTRGRGFILHTALGVRTDLGQPHVLGVAMQHVWTRHTVNKGTETRTQRAQRRTEYDIWAETLQEIGPVPQGCTWVSVGDRGSDVFAHLRVARSLQWHALIRVAQNRNIRVSGGMAKMLSWIRDRHWTLETTFEQRAKDGQGARTIRLGIAYDSCEVCAPRNGPERTHAALPVWCVRAFDLETQGQEVEWVLLCTLPVTSATQALEKVRWYTHRWVVEEYHKCLKTGCRIEARQLQTADRLARLLGFLSVVAVRLLMLRDATRYSPDVIAQTWVDPGYVALIARRLGVPQATLTLRTFWRAVACLGGFLGRQSDGEPGWQTIWRDWTRLQDLTWYAHSSAPPLPPSTSG